MQRKLIGTLCIASLGAALALAGPATAQQMHKGGAAPSHAAAGAQHMGRHAARAGASHMGMRAGAGFRRHVAENNFHGAAGTQFRHGGRRGSGGQWSARHGGQHWAGRHHRNRGGFGAGFGVGLALGAAPYYSDPYYYDNGYDYYAAAPAISDADVQYCIEHFKSYDLATRTYLGYDGQRHSCP